MASSNEIAKELLPFIRIYKDGRVERLLGTGVAPASVDAATGVTSKDVVILPDLGVSARLYLPKLTDPTQKLPVLIYYHGGGFCIETPFSPQYHSYLNSVVAQGNVVAVSVDYRRTPEHLLPAAYDDSWAGLQWVASHAQGGSGTEPWLRDHADLTKIFLSGDSAGGNICHVVAMRAADNEIGYGVSIYGLILAHPYFWGQEPIGNELKDPVMKEFEEELWRLGYPSLRSFDEPFMNPAAPTSPSLSKLACQLVIIYVAEHDILRDRDWLYYNTLRSSGWKGTVEILETKDEDHVFHLKYPTSENSVQLMQHLLGFLSV